MLSKNGCRLLINGEENAYIINTKVLLFKKIFHQLIAHGMCLKDIKSILNMPTTSILPTAEF